MLGRHAKLAWPTYHRNKHQRNRQAPYNQHVGTNTDDQTPRFPFALLNMPFFANGEKGLI
jgi:hypothetical protein